MSTAAAIPQGRTATTAAPGATAPLSTMGVAKSALLFVGVAGVMCVGLRLTFGGKELPPLRMDAVEIVKIYAGYQMVNIPLKLLAYHFHGHDWSQAVLVFT